MKKSFVTGLVILIPLAVTLIAIRFLLSVLTMPFLNRMIALANALELFPNGFLFLSHKRSVLLLCELLSLVSLGVLIVMIGWLARWLFITTLWHRLEELIERIPLIGGIYRTFREVIHALFSSTSPVSLKAVLIPFPRPDVYALGLAIRDSMTLLPTVSTSSLVSIFVPGSLNPTMGFMILYPKEQCHYLDMSVSDAVKTIVSAGVVFPKPLRKLAANGSLPTL